MTEDGTRWSHTSGEAEELNKLTANYELMKSSSESFKRGKEERKKQREEREKREKEEQGAKEKEAREKGQGK
jgi:hypothetical protein